MSAGLGARGWRKLEADARSMAWARAARQAARDVLADEEMQARWLRHGGTWFAGVDALPNGPDGAVGGAPLAGPWDGLIEPPARWHRAQLSVCHPGYPGRDAAESAAAHRFRRDRDAAHLDGLLPEGPDRRRHLREPHAFLLGIGLTEAAPGAAPFPTYVGAQEIVRAAFRGLFAGVPAGRWGDLDVTEGYQRARAEVFETCPRVELPLQPGEALVVHRLAIHGTAPWAPAARAAEEGRAVAWFRPLTEDPARWLDAP